MLELRGRKWFARNAVAAPTTMLQFVHDTFRKHLQLGKFTDELDQTETLSLGLHSSVDCVVLVRI